MLAAYIVSIPALLPMAFVAFASLEGSHGVDVRVCGEEVRVVLTHGEAGRAVSHHQIHAHRMAARLLAFAAVPENDGGPDHQLKFTSAMDRWHERTTDAVDGLEATICPPPMLAVLAAMAADWEGRQPADIPRRGQLPRASATLKGLRSTLLLI